MLIRDWSQQPPADAYDLYLWVDGVPGKSPDADHDNGIEPDSFRFGVVTFKSDNVGLSADDVSFGNAEAEPGDSAADARITTAALLPARNNRSSFLHQARLDFPYDFVQIVDIDFLHVIEHHGLTQIPERACRTKVSSLEGNPGVLNNGPESGIIRKKSRTSNRQAYQAGCCR